MSGRTVTKNYEIQFYDRVNNAWMDSGFLPSMHDDVIELDVWKAFVSYLAVAYPDDLYRLVEVIVTKEVELIHV